MNTLLVSTKVHQKLWSSQSKVLISTFHSRMLKPNLNPIQQKSVNALSYRTADPVDKLHGSYHWVMERGASFATLGLISAAAISPHPMVDFGLAFIIPIHCHIGFGAIITDYLPKRKFPFIYQISTISLYVLTLSTIYGLYQYNTNDVGITEGVKKLWNKEKAVKE